MNITRKDLSKIILQESISYKIELLERLDKRSQKALTNHLRDEFANRSQNGFGMADVVRDFVLNPKNSDSRENLRNFLSQTKVEDTESLTKRLQDLSRQNKELESDPRYEELESEKKEIEEVWAETERQNEELKEKIKNLNNKVKTADVDQLRSINKDLDDRLQQLVNRIKKLEDSKPESEKEDSKPTVNSRQAQSYKFDKEKIEKSIKAAEDRIRKINSELNSGEVTPNSKEAAELGDKRNFYIKRIEDMRNILKKANKEAQ